MLPKILEIYIYIYIYSLFHKHIIKTAVLNIISDESQQIKLKPLNSTLSDTDISKGDSRNVSPRNYPIISDN